MSRRNKYSIIIAVGLVIFASGWAIRSTFMLHGYSNKPVGGILVAVGMFIMGYYAYKLLKR